ncbi:hypothetical protein Hamer_G001509 [Homarus americanus]|uniref:Uncharacterized protein n=1 Tax=Homarus americanus TaxID=6706 RepID=A0A8J5N960_HOMAM|nr:hypothetical protein Hamer_G001509 [Homarus americanus]
MKVVVTLLVVVVTLLHYGEAVKCYNKKVVECTGSCFTKKDKDDKILELGCHGTQKEGSTTGEGVVINYCNKDKCNSAVSNSFNFALLTLGVLLYRLK